jgi:hypothetical protein
MLKIRHILHLQPMDGRAMTWVYFGLNIYFTAIQAKKPEINTVY